jgi:oligopeptide transport system substrate-binding protein
MRVKIRAMAAVGATSLLLLAACGGGGGSTPQPGSSQSAGQAGGEVTLYGCTPKNPLVPGNTNESCGSYVVVPITAKLIKYDVENASPINDIAESIETKDNKLFTVKLKPYKFHDGTEVKAKNFVDAWNYTAYGPNGQANSYFFAPVTGYAGTQCPDADCKQAPKTKTMTGLKVVDDKTFTIQTAEPVSNLPVRLGYNAFAPLPDSFFADPKAYEEKPIGAGPFKLESKTNTEFVLTKFADYGGDPKPSVDKVTLRIYQDSAAAYADIVANNLDYLDTIPPDQLVGEAFKDDLPDRWLQREAGRFSNVTFSPWDPQMKDNVELRKALSMAIDRNLIADKVFNNTVTPATGWVSPVVDGFKAGACGDACNFDAAKAKAAYDAAGGYKGTLTMTYNADNAINKAYSEAICNSIKNAVGADCRAVPTVDFATFQKKLDGKELKGMFRQGWVMDYPSIENFLSPIYSKGAIGNGGSNYSEYNNPAFEKLLVQAAAAKTSDEANTLYQQAEALLGKDMPTAPLWYPKTTVGFSDKVTNVKVDAFEQLDLVALQTK